MLEKILDLITFIVLIQYNFQDVEFLPHVTDFLDSLTTRNLEITFSPRGYQNYQLIKDFYNIQLIPLFRYFIIIINLVSYVYSFQQQTSFGFEQGLQILILINYKYSFKNQSFKVSKIGF
ncbi:unnamed protein product (macronuclear) [Paramecium tetraurelia]|uniref:Transmembrane protein n=1 Tax=Paramecium tetraurelia TaxID=5888 RepID=A0DTD2_PARTE|nr:uncharacterized protein GSPATT00039755001 [Paramecium tetraurelia]CAK86299.1 unnamed protein product [Paramecium tetraurelia]|eukprot:XP_001453696.1 hypothetical protein (macronuclear) [Paramecium tetraurelia strain d4-2]